MNKLGVVFVGQGSQYHNMSLDFLETYSDLQTIFDVGKIVLGYDPKNIIGTVNNQMHETLYTQPMVLLASLVAYEAFMKLEPNISAIAGFSLGEYSAYYASGVLDIDVVIKIIQRRAELMDQAQAKQPGKMAAVLGLNKNQIEEIVASFQDTRIVVANYNAPLQFVISGLESLVEKAIEKAKDLGAKRAVYLNVSGAFHSPLMSSAAQSLFEEVANIPVHTPTKPLFLNTTGKRHQEEPLKEVMRDQLMSSVNFTKMIESMKKEGITHIIEIGPGRVLSGLIKKIDTTIHVENIDNKEDLIRVKGWLEDNGFTK